jgi:hypothetical protein
MPAEVKYGLNKLARLTAEREARQSEDLAALRLQPDWPYQAQSFDPEFFGVEASPSPADSLKT